MLRHHNKAWFEAAPSDHGSEPAQILRLHKSLQRLVL
jgi:hypothetical protein